MKASNIKIRTTVLMLFALLIVWGIPSFGETSQDIPSEIQNADHMSLTDVEEILDRQASDAYPELRQDVEKLQKCVGLFLQEWETGRVYTADIDIYYQTGEPYLSIKYDNYMGELYDAPVVPASEEGYLFFSSPTGILAGSIEQEFSIWLGEEKIRIMWEEGSCDYTLKRSSGSAEELESKKPSFAESEHYTSLTESLAKALKSSQTHFYYDEDDCTLYCYVASNASRESTIAYYQNRTEEWEKLMEGLCTLSEKSAQVVSLYIREGIYQIQKGHCSILLLEELNDNDKYFAGDTLAMITDGKVDYSVFQDRAISELYDIIGNTDDYVNNDSNTISDSSEYSGGSGEMASSGERNALQRAKDYLEYTAFSYEGLIEQLEFEGYSYSEAAYGADHCGADWYEQAVKKARDYLDYTSFSLDGLVEQLEYEGFTYEQALYGAQQAY